MNEDDRDYVPSGDNEAKNEEEQEEKHEHEEDNAKLTYPLLNLQFTPKKEYRNIKTKEVLDEYHLVGKFVEYLNFLIERRFCRYFNSKGISKCDCLHNMLEVNNNVVVAIALFMVRYYFPLPPAQKSQHLIFAIRNAASLKIATKKQQCFMIPFLADGGDYLEIDLKLTFKYMCVNAFTALYNIGKKKMKRLLLQAPGCFVADHGNVGKQSVKKNNVEAYDDLRERLQYLRDNYSTPFATRVVRNEAGFLDTKDDGKAVYLPPSFSMRNEWKEWCYERGWTIKHKCRSKAICEKIDNWEKREHDDHEEVPTWPTGRESKPVMTWPSFHNFWKREFSDLKVIIRNVEPKRERQIRQRRK